MARRSAQAPVAPAAETPAIDAEAARQHYERATAAYALGNFAEAALSYEKAFEQKPDPALLYNAAQAHRRAGNRTRAVELYRSFLQVFPRADNREVAERHLRELERAAELEAQAAAPPPLLAAPPPPAVAPPATPVRSAEPRPTIWQRRWLWVGIGAGALLAGTVAAFALSGQDDPQPTWGRVGP
jgi:tetratricopeptide (TPR) repeat protein